MPWRVSLLGLLLACCPTAAPARADDIAACIAEAAHAPGPDDPAFTVIAMTPLADDPGTVRGDGLAADLAALFGEDAALRFLTFPCPLFDAASESAALRRAADHGEDLAQRVGASVVIWGRVGDDALELYLSHPLDPNRDRFAAAPLSRPFAHGDALSALVAVDALNLAWRSRPGTLPEHVAAFERIAARLDPFADPPPDMPPRLRAQRLDAAGRLIWMTATSQRAYGQMIDADELLEAAQAVYAELGDGWAMANMANDRGLILQLVAQETGETAHLERAAAAFRAALQGFSRAARSINWAQTHANLGQTLHTLGELTRNPAPVAEAVGAYRAALEVWTQAETPFDWARTQSRLGNALVTFVDLGGDPALLDEAVARLNAALAVQEREATPTGRAETRTALGHALTALGWEHDSADHLARAVAAYRLALDETPREIDYVRWGLIQYRMGLSLLGLGVLRGDLPLLAEAAAAQQAALDAWPAGAMPLLRMRAKLVLTDAFWTMADATDDPAYLSRTAETLTAALELMPDGYMPEVAGQLHSDLAMLQVQLWDAEDDAADDARLRAGERHATTAVRLLEPFGASSELDLARARLGAIREELGR